jgi:hypothetical protein
VLLSLVFASFRSAQGMPEINSCPEIVETALALTEQQCGATGRNQACYGNALLQAQPQPGSNNFTFEKSGDIVSVAELQSLRMSAMDINNGLWGVALMRLQTSFADNDPTHNVTMLLFGDVELENRVSVPIPVVVTHEREVVFTQPSIASFRVAQVRAGQTMTATGRSQDGNWLRVRLANSQSRGWISSTAARPADRAPDLSTLAVVTARTPDYAPMQAFYFQSGNNSACPEAPADGLVIQTPEGDAEVSLLINEVNVQIGSTVYFQAQRGQQMTVSVVEGAAEVAAYGEVHRAAAGTQITLPVDQNLVPVGPPSSPAPYRMQDVQTIPVDLLERNVDVHPPLSAQEAEDEDVPTLATEDIPPPPTETPTDIPSETPTETPTDIPTETMTPTDEPTSTSTPTLMPTWTEIPTLYDWLTETLWPADTDTPEPTNTDIPTDTPTPDTPSGLIGNPGINANTPPTEPSTQATEALQ